LSFDETSLPYSSEQLIVPPVSGEFRFQIRGGPQDHLIAPEQTLSVTITPVDLSPVAVRLGEVVTRPAQIGGFVRELELTLAEAHRVLVDNLTPFGSGDVGFSSKCSTSKQLFSGGFVELKPGSYRMTVGTSTFAMIDLETVPAVPQNGELLGRLEPGVIQAFRFDANAGEQFYLDSVITSEFIGFAYVLGPEGVSIASTPLLTDLPRFTAPFSGQYFLVLSPNEVETVSSQFHFRLYRVPPALPQPLFIPGAMDAPVITLQFSGTEAKATWRANSGVRYRLERSTDLVNWTRFDELIGDGTERTWPISITEGISEYFRVLAF
jgi:hypothetical protein